MERWKAAAGVLYLILLVFVVPTIIVGALYGFNLALWILLLLIIGACFCLGTALALLSINQEVENMARCSKCKEVSEHLTKHKGGVLCPKCAPSPNRNDIYASQKAAKQTITRMVDKLRFRRARSQRRY